MLHPDLPWSDTCFVCGDRNPKGLGVRFKVVNDEVRLDTVVDRDFEGFPGHLHGGVISALLDETAGWACTVATGRLCYTVELTVRFKRPVPGGAAISVIGRHEGEPNGRLLKGSGRIEDENGQELATAEGLYYPLPAEQQQQIVPLLKMPGRPARHEDIRGAIRS